MRGKRVYILLVATSLFVSGLFSVASADRYTSTSYIIDASVLSATGGAQTSASYKLTSSTGENVVGNGAGSSYLVGMGYVAQLGKSLQLTMQPNGLVVYYPLDENSGSMTYDNSINTNVGNLQASPTWMTGKLGNALSFNGSSQYVALNDLDVSGSAITVSAWVYPTVAAQNGKVVGKHSSTTDAQGTLGLTSGNATFETTTGGVYHIATSASTLALNTWSYIVGVYDGANTKVYVNGVLATPVASTGALANNNYGWAIGRINASTSSNYFTGSIDEVKILSRALNDSDVLAEYNAVIAGSPAGISLGTITPGASNTVLADIITQTDAGGYTLAINQNHDLQSSSYTIPAILGSVASPLVWTEGSTKGLGFTLTATNATAIPGTWNSGNSYAAFPGTATTFYTRSGLPTPKDYLTMRLRADVASSQAALDYTNAVTVTGTITP